MTKGTSMPGTKPESTPRDVQIPCKRYERMKKLAQELAKMCAVPPERQRIMSIINATKELSALFEEKVSLYGTRPRNRRKEVPDVQGDQRISAPSDQKAG